MINKLKESLEQERVGESERYHSSATYKAGHQAACDRLLPLLEENLEVIKFYAETRNHQMIHDSGDGFVNTSNIDLDVGKKAREFLKKYYGEK